MTIKITLDVGAVERLIGGDTEMEIEIRNRVVQELTRHLKDNGCSRHRIERNRLRSVC